jgi:hypothetical protein
MGSSYVDRDDTVVKGDDGSSDGAKITVTTDGAKKRLDVAATITAVIGTQSYSDKIKNEYSGSTISLSGAAYQNVYSYSGSGFLCSFVINSSSDDLEVQLVVDGNTVFTNITSKIISDLGIRTVSPSFFFGGTGAGSFFYEAKNFPIKYDSSVLIQARRVTGGSMSISRLLVNIVKET